MASIKIVRSWEDRNFQFGINSSGQLFVKHKGCDQTMTMIDFKISNNKKTMIFGCSKCGIKHTI